jgi:aldehyde dehydrogenase (NAD+)
MTNLIGGEWIGGAESVISRNPSDLSDTIGEFPVATAAQVAQAVAAARDALPGWSATSFRDRQQVLQRISTEIRRRAEEIGRLLSREEGKPLREGIGEAYRAAELFDYYAAECLRQFSETAQSIRPNTLIEVSRGPVGVVAVIAPWNFPVALPAWKIAPALAYGNCVVFKPSEIVPATSFMLAQTIAESGLPAGVFNMVIGAGGDTGAALVGDQNVDAISFTGSVRTGEKIAAAGIAHMAKLQLEMGGKNPLVVLDDADLSLAVECAIQGAFFSTGQRCTASSRLIVTKGIHDRFVAGVAERMAGLIVGHALDEATMIGPVVSEAQLDRDLQYLEIGRQEGARLLRGGSRVKGRSDGYYLEPALFVDTTSSMRINQEEIFGPIAAVIPVNSYEEALAVANDTEFGLTAGIITSSAKYASDFRARAEAGVVTVNLPTVGLDFHVPFGGRKRSSYGPREQGSYARDFYTETRIAYVATN